MATQPDYSQTSNLDDVNTLQVWWQDIQPALGGFYEITEEMTIDSPRQQIAMWLFDCEDTHSFIEQVPTPETLHGARYYLLQALNDIITALAYQIAGDKARSDAYRRSARIEFEFAQSAVFDPIFVH